MEDRSAASAGVAMIGVALVATALAWATIGLPHGPASLPGWSVSLAFVGAFGGVIAAYGDGRGLPAVGRALKAVGWSLLVGFSGLLAITVWTTLLWVAVSSLAPGEPGTTYRLALGAVALGLGTGTVALIYFRWTGKSLSYLDFRVPTKRDVGYFAAGVLALFGLQIGVSVLFAQLGLSTASHSVEQAAQTGDPTILLLLIPASWLIIGPGEELLYRNIIQKSLYDIFGEWGAVIVASVVFALAHILAYAGGASSLVSLANTLAVIFLLSLILGATYLKTDNLTVSAAIHGTFDAVVFAAMYVQITGGP